MALDQDNGEEQERSSDKEMSFFDHIDVLRKHLFRSAFAIVACTIVGFIYMDTIFHEIILGPLRDDFVSYRFMCDLSHRIYHNDQFCIGHINIMLLNTEMAGQFMLSFKLAFIFGIIVAMPYVLYQVWLFIKPALSKKEHRKTRGFVFYTSFLFILGILFGYFVMSPISVNFLSNYTLSPLIENRINVSNILGFLTLIVLGSGFIFELPLVMYFLAKLGLITASFLKKYRKHAIIVILIIAAIATPPDVVSQVVMTIPLYSLFELGIVIIQRVEKQEALKNE